ncbi:MAG: NAD-binding protein, partial [Planctomycetota bacterium]
MLCRRHHSVTVVDSDPEVVQRINSELDVRAVCGNAAQSTLLFQCDVFGADLVLSVTGTDEVNLVAASMAKKLGARRTVARVYAPAYHDLSTFDYQSHFGIDSMLSLEQLTATELARTIRNPDSIPLEHFARGQLEVHELEVASHAEAAGKLLKDLRLHANVRLG